MKVVKITDAKNNLSRHLAYVRRGGSVRIVDRDVPVADLVPVNVGTGSGDDAKLLEALERDGVLRRGRGGPVPRELLQPGPGRGGARVVDALLEERRSGR